MHHAHLVRPIGACELGDAAAVGEHQPGGAQPARHRLAAGGGAGGGVEHIAPVHRYHERHVEANPLHGIPGWDGVVGMDQLEAGAAAQTAQSDPQRGRCPSAPRRVGAPPRRGDIGDVGDGQAVADLVSISTHPVAQQAAERVRSTTRSGVQRGARRHQTMQHQHVHLRSRGLCGERLTVRPHPQHGIARAGVELRYDGDLHQRRWVRSVVWASAAFRWGRSASSARASATAAPRE